MSSVCYSPGPFVVYIGEKEKAKSEKRLQLDECAKSSYLRHDKDDSSESWLGASLVVRSEIHKVYDFRISLTHSEIV